MAEGYTGRYIGMTGSEVPVRERGKHRMCARPLDHEYICVAVKRPGAVVAWGKKDSSERHSCQGPASSCLHLAEGCLRN